ncbi:MAG: hypothetical protein WAX66_02090 [Patescibacteria group bacterium]
MLNSLSLFVTNVYAEVSTEPINPLGDDVTNLQELFTWITNLIIIVGLGVAVVFLALGFIKFITSQGDKVATEQAQKSVTYAILGGVGVFLVYLVKALVLNILGAEDPLEGN